MKKSQIKGYAAFALLSELDDDMIAAAALPAEDTAVVSASGKRGSFRSMVAHVSAGRWAAAAVTVVAALAVLWGLAAMGQQTGMSPPASDGMPLGPGQNRPSYSFPWENYEEEIKDGHNESMKPDVPGNMPGNAPGNVPGNAPEGEDSNELLEPGEQPAPGAPTDDIPEGVETEVGTAQPETDPRIILEGSRSTLYFAGTRNGYMLWVEVWYDDGLISGDGIGAESQLAELVADGALDGFRLMHTVHAPLELTLEDAGDTLTRVTVYDKDLNRLGGAPDFTVIHDLPAGEYIVILRIQTKGNYIPEADAYEGACYEYPFYLDIRS